jgi:hypothetical protein
MFVSCRCMWTICQRVHPVCSWISAPPSLSIDPFSFPRSRSRPPSSPSPAAKVDGCEREGGPEIGSLGRSSPACRPCPIAFRKSGPRRAVLPPPRPRSVARLGCCVAALLPQACPAFLPHFIQPWMEPSRAHRPGEQRRP